MTDRTLGAEQDEDARPAFTQLADRSHGSFELVLSPLLLALLGWWIDGRLGTGPWLVIGFACFGLAGAVTKVLLSYRAEMDAHRQATLAARAERDAARRAESLGEAA